MATTTRERRNLVTDRIWLCSEVHNCDSCPVKAECQTLCDEFSEYSYYDPAKVEQFLAAFQELVSKIMP